MAIVRFSLLLWASRLGHGSASTSATSSGAEVGAAILSGLGGAPNATNSATAASGLEAAQSCDVALSSWREASNAWVLNHYHNQTSTYTGTLTYSSTQIPVTTKVTKLITLCDGHPRVVGHATTINTTSLGTVSSWTNTYTTEVHATTYPSPMPCSINPSECQLLYDSVYDFIGTAATTASYPAFPQCTTTTSYVAPSACKSSWSAYDAAFSSYHSITASTASYPTVTQPECPNPTTKPYTTDGSGQTCDGCQVIGDHARLLYWPITTEPIAGDLCNETAKTVPGTPTGEGPNTFVTGDLTITSPTVAISWAGLRRIDGCGSTVANTIIPVKPEEVASVRGYHALFEHYGFNFADLNYKCLSSNETVYGVPDPVPDDCYQEVPAAAYFGGLNWAGEHFVLNMSAQTIYDDYRPQILPPDTMIGMMNSIWGSGGDSCTFHPDGIWDPPRALTEAQSVKGPSLALGEVTSTFSSTATPATPASTTTAMISATAAPELSDTSQRGSLTAAVPSTSDISLSSQDPDSVATAAPVLSGSSQRSSLIAAIPSSSADEVSLQDPGTAQEPNYTQDPESAQASTTPQDPAGAIASLLGGAASSTSDPIAGTTTQPSLRSTAAISSSADPDVTDTVSVTPALSDPSSTVPTIADPTTADISDAEVTHKFTSGTSTQSVVGTQTLAAGSAVAVGGTTYSLASSGSALVVSGAATPLDTTSLPGGVASSIDSIADPSATPFDAPATTARTASDLTSPRASISSGVAGSQASTGTGAMSSLSASQAGPAAATQSTSGTSSFRLSAAYMGWWLWPMALFSAFAL